MEWTPTHENLPSSSEVSHVSETHWFYPDRLAVARRAVGPGAGTPPPLNTCALEDRCFFSVAIGTARRPCDDSAESTAKLCILKGCVALFELRSSSEKIFWRKS